MICIGLGNPCSRYEKTRHNIGFLALDRISAHYCGSAWRRHGSIMSSSVDVFGTRVTLVKPYSGMNCSGRAVSSLFPIDSSSVVIHDDIDLPLCSVKVKHGGGSGGHNGIRDISAHFDLDYWRLRIGVDRPSDNLDVRDYVVSNFSDDEMSMVVCSVSVIAELFPIMLKSPTDFASEYKKSL